MEDLVLSCLESRVEESRNLYARFLIGPFFKGDALTVATALRRVLLSSVESVAITALYIQGITHEFSSIVGVRESVLELSLNFQSIILCYDKNFFQKKSFFEDFQIGYLQVQGPKVVYANDLKLPLGVKVVYPTQYIATVSREGVLVIKFTISKIDNRPTGNLSSHSSEVPSRKQMIHHPVFGELVKKNIVKTKRKHSYKSVYIRKELHIRPNKSKIDNARTTQHRRFLKSFVKANIGDKHKYLRDGIQALLHFARTCNSTKYNVKGLSSLHFALLHVRAKCKSAKEKGKTTYLYKMNRQYPFNAVFERGYTRGVKCNKEQKTLKKEKWSNEFFHFVMHVKNLYRKKRRCIGKTYVMHFRSKHLSLAKQNHHCIRSAYKSTNEKFVSTKICTCNQKQNLQKNLSFSEKLINLSFLQIRNSFFAKSDIKRKDKVFQSDICLRNIIPLDFALPPILRVNFVVEVDDEVLYLRQKVRERIILEVWTNGSIHPRQAVHDATLSLLDMFSSFRFIYQMKSHYLPLLQLPQYTKKPQTLNGKHRMTKAQKNKFINRQFLDL